LNMFFPFSSVSNQTYLLRKNRYQLTVFDRLNSYQIFLQNKPSYQILLKINEFEGKWQNLNPLKIPATIPIII